MIDMKPYVQWKKDDYILRVFHPQVDNDELVWHRDKNDRLVEVVDSDGWLFQFDNQFPYLLVSGMILRIDADKYHRILKSDDCGILSVKIYEGKQYAASNDKNSFKKLEKN